MQPPTPAAASEPVPRPPPGPVPTRIANVTTEHRADMPRLHVAAVARRVGVAPSTLRTWDRRYGIGPTDHSPGRHRRYSPDDLARLDLMHRALIQGATPADAAAHALAALPAHPDAARPPPATTGRDPGAGTRTGDSRPLAGAGEQQPAGAGGGERLRARTGGTALRLPGAGRRARALGRPALALDADTARGLLADSIAATGVQATWDDVLRPVLAAVAQRWADTGAGIEIEHLLSDCVTAVFSAVAATAVPARTARAGTARRDGGRSAPTTPGRTRHDTRAAGGVLQVAGRRPAFDGTGDGDPAHRTGGGAAVVPAESTADPQVLRSLPRTRPEYRSFVAGPGWAEMELPPRVGRLESLVDATDALSAAATA